MRKFNYKNLAEKCWDNDILLLCSRIHESKGRQELFVRQKPAQLERLYRTTLIISKKPGNTGISRDIRTEFTTDLLLSD